MNQFSYWLVRLGMRPFMSFRMPIALQRIWSDLVGLFLIRPRRKYSNRIQIGGVETLEISSKGRESEWGVLYLHGGGFVSCSDQSHTALASWVGHAAKATVWLPNYRLAPEHVYPNAINDALTVYTNLIAGGQDPQKLIIAGDSAGGGLALATALRIKSLGLPKPAGLVLYSPWVDLSLSGRSVITHAHRDAMLKPEWVRWCADQYRGALLADDPNCSPLFADLSGLPPTLIHVGSEEILLSDSARLASKLKASGVDTTYRMFEGVGHVFQFLTGILPQAKQSILDTEHFVAQLSSSNLESEYDYDVVVVGSGFGGSVSALRLSEKGYSVGVMEMGRRWSPENLPKSNWNLAKYIWRPMIGLKGFFNMRPFKHAMIIHGNAVGGGSITYAQTLLVPPQKIWEEGTWAGLDDWDQVMPPHYHTAQKMLGVAEAKRLGPADHALKKMADAHGVGHTFYKSEVGVFFGDDDDTTGGRTYPDPYFNGEGPDRTSCVGCGECMTGCRHNAKNTLDKNYLYLAENRGTRVHEETEVMDVKPLNNKPNGEDGYEIITQLSGSWMARNRRSFKARKVIFAASSLGTQELLFKLKQSGSLPRVSDELGKRVRTNSESIVCVRVPGGEDMSKGVGIGSGIYIDKDTHVEAMRYGAGHDLLGTTFTPLTGGQAGWTRILTWIGTMTRLMLTRPMTFLRIVNPIGFAKETIMLLCLQALDSSLNMVYKRPWYNPFTKVLQTEGDGVPAYIPQANAFAQQSAELLNGVALSGMTEILFNVPTTGHCMGGAGMGDSRETGVVDHQNRVFGYENMWICDASVLSANLGVNPALTITALTERAMSFIPAKAGVPIKQQVFIPIQLAKAA